MRNRSRKSRRLSRRQSRQRSSSIRRSTTHNRNTSRQRRSTTHNRNTSRQRRSTTRNRNTNRQRRSTARNRNTSRQRRSTRNRNTSRQRRCRQSQTNNIINVLNVFVKSLAGDLIHVEILDNETVLHLKHMISKTTGMNIENIILISPETEQSLNHTYDNHTLKQCGVKNNDMLLLFNNDINNIEEPPFKGQKMIQMAGGKIKGAKKHFHPKIPNPAGWALIDKPSFEGSVDDPQFLEWISRIPTNFKDNLRKVNPKDRLDIFKKELEEAGDRLRFAYYKDMSHRGFIQFEFVATNEDSSVVYVYTPVQTKYYIRGYPISYSLWKELTVDQRRNMLRNDDSLKDAYYL